MKYRAIAITHEGEKHETKKYATLYEAQQAGKKLAKKMNLTDITIVDDDGYVY